MPTWPLDQPFADDLSFVRGIIVHDQMHVEIGRHVCLDFVQELAELARPVAWVAFSDDMARCNIECGEQRCCAVALVIMGPLGDLAGAHRKHRLAAIKRLDLRLFIDAQHDSTGWWRHVKADNIAHLVDKIIQPQREFPACIRRGSPRQHIPPASASQEPCEDGSRYSPADRPRSWLGHRPVTGTRVPGSKRDLVLEEIFQGINLG